MGWHQRDRGASPDDGLREWERDDGLATVRVRERVDGDWVVRLDVLHQASTDRTYRRERTDSRSAALALAEEWRDAFETTAGTDTGSDGSPDASDG
jgi:hypothetical protein